MVRTVACVVEGQTQKTLVLWFWRTRKVKPGNHRYKKVGELRRERAKEGNPKPISDHPLTHTCSEHTQSRSARPTLRLSCVQESEFAIQTQQDYLLKPRKNNSSEKNKGSEIATT